jgi:hypothetical protein
VRDCSEAKGPDVNSERLIVLDLDTDYRWTSMRPSMVAASWADRRAMGALT